MKRPLSRLANGGAEEPLAKAPRRKAEEWDRFLNARGVGGARNRFTRYLGVAVRNSIPFAPLRLCESCSRLASLTVSPLSLPVVLRSIAVLVTLAVAALPEVGLGDDDPPASRMTRAVRRVHVHRVWSAPGMESDPLSGMSLSAHVEAVGLKWRSLLVEVRLRTPDGKPVPVAADAPRGYADAKGRFSMSTRTPVFDDSFEWPELRASIPYEKVLDLPADRPQRLIATFRVSCEGLSSVSESEITIPPGKPPRVIRAVRLLAIDPFPNSLPLPSRERAGVRGNTQLQPGSHSSPDPKSPQNSGRDFPTTSDRGLAVEAYVEAVGLDGRSMTGRLSFRREDGKPLVSTDRSRGAPKPVESVRQSDCVSDQAQILSHFVDYGSLSLQPGLHRLILSYAAQCDGLTATIEEEHVLHRLMIDD